MFFLKLLLTLAFLMPSFGFAQSPVVFEGGQATLIAKHNTLAPNSQTQVGWLIELEPGWHTYWKNAGDTGLGAQFKWQGAPVGPVLWPTPKVIPVDPFMSYGYENEVLFLAPLQANKKNIGDEILLSSHIQFLVCKEICLPAEATSTILLPIQQNAMLSPYQTLFAKAEKMAPTPFDFDQKVKQNDTHYFIPLSEKIGRQVRFIPAVEDVINDSAKQSIVSLSDGFYLQVEKESFNPAPIKNLEGILQTPLQNWQVSMALQPYAGPISSSLVVGDVSFDLSALIPFLLAAFLAGVILNLMPCVLPVIGLKILHLSQHRNFAHVASFTVGVLAAFWAMAGIVWALKGTGQVVGWGFHLQNFYFVCFLIVLLLLVALNLLGVFEIRFTTTVKKEPKGLLGGFSNGWLVALLATPCTAPFMGAAVGVAFTQNLAVMVAIFSGLGLGLAFPYVAIACVPGLRHVLPKPGQWMLSFKKFLAFPILATAIWLLWVFNNLGGDIPHLLVGCLLIAFLAWAYGTKHHKFWGALMLVAVAFSVTLPWFGHNIKPSNLTWQPWSTTTVENARATGRPVFINFTADWCITCKVNEALVFSSPKVAAEVKAKNLLLLKADWTNKNEAIANQLAAYGRAGVPLYIYYPAGGEEAVKLPQILTPSLWLEHIKDAR